MNKKQILIWAGVLGGVAAVGGIAASIWNSEQMRAARAAKRASKILYKVGAVMQTVSGIADS